MKGRKCASVSKKSQSIEMRKSVISYIREYSSVSTVHGLSHIFRENTHIIHRLIWCCILIISLVGCCYMLMDSLILYEKKPISIILQNTDYPLNHFPFPTISICPITKINVSYFTEYISGVVDDEKWGEDIDKFLMVLNSLVHPYFPKAFETLQELNDSSFLQAVQQVNITRLMHLSMPKCESIFKHCHWNGDDFNCCRGFKLIRSEDGFCYSFNTLMENLHNNCQFPIIPRDQRVQEPEECKLKYTWLTGTMSGLQVALQQYYIPDPFFSAAKFPVFKKEELVTLHSPDLFFLNICGTSALEKDGLTFLTKIRDLSERVYVSGLKRDHGIYVHCAHELPEPGMGFLVSLEDKSKIGVSVKPRIIQAPYGGIEKELPEIRNCLIPKEEEELSITTIYSQSSCVMQCRADMIIKACNCSPYHFKFPGVEDCKSTSLLCVAKTSKLLNEGLFTIDSKESTFCGRNCLPKCSEVTYSYTIDREDVFIQEDEGVLEVYFRNEGALHYIRQLTFSRENLIVNLGGIVGLFLGSSVISFIELLFWLIKVLFAVILTRSQVAPSKSRPLPPMSTHHLQTTRRDSLFVVNAWYN